MNVARQLPCVLAWDASLNDSGIRLKGVAVQSAHTHARSVQDRQLQRGHRILHHLQTGGERRKIFGTLKNICLHSDNCACCSATRRSWTWWQRRGRCETSGWTPSTTPWACSPASLTRGSTRCESEVDLKTKVHQKVRNHGEGPY